ncbi:uncharacterized protein PAC_08706 [Phialocephala subalpina]|uniref:Protein kinase domain-containing protein n=1 Tax=Phialocephala subalpina TaxID=576137 RepID=A0A1L7X1B3_9HELO|nr:uncharacterized protein PAC_08706 [Phialocephala subalpina]
MYQLSGLYAWLEFVPYASRLLGQSLGISTPSTKPVLTPDQEDAPLQASWPRSLIRREDSSSNSSNCPAAIVASSTSQKTSFENVESTTRRNDMSAITEQQIRESIRARMLYLDAINLEFIPETLLRNIITQSAVESVLQNSSNLTLNSSIPELARFYSAEAFKVFAILVMNHRLNLIEHFYENRFQNYMLPVKGMRVENENESWIIEPCNVGREAYDREKMGKTFQWLENSYQAEYFWKLWQWPYIPPVFTREKFRYDFPDEIHLPFTRSSETKPSESNYSNVEGKSVHIDHFPRDFETAMDDQGNPRVAIKQLKHSGGDFKNVAEGEASVLEIMRTFQNEHLIKAIAYYKKDGKHYFMFPWAEMGNLSEFWKENTPKTEPYYIAWMLTQLSGLASAIQEMHHMAAESESNCRHGDLKPANILCFRTQNGRGDDPRLVITDVGLAKVHNQATQWREQTVSTASTVKYSAPELGIDSNAPRSRRFDIWSLGCIFLEFVIWQLYGNKGLQNFSKELGSDAYYELTNETSSYLAPETRKVARLHPLVAAWIKYIKDKDWRCSKGSAIERLVELIETRLLNTKVNYPDAKKNGTRNLSTEKPISKSEAPKATNFWIEELAPSPQSQTPGLTRTFVGEPASITGNQGAPGSRIRDAASLTLTWELPQDPKYRAYAPEMTNVLNGILADLRDNKIVAIGKKPTGGTPTPIGLQSTRISSGDGGHSTSTITRAPASPNTISTQISNCHLAQQENEVSSHNSIDASSTNVYSFCPYIILRFVSPYLHYWQSLTYSKLNDNWLYEPDDTIAKEVLTGVDSSTIFPRAWNSFLLCHRCSGLRLWSSTNTFMDSPAGLEEKAKKQGCMLCRLLSQSMPIRAKEHTDFISSYLTIDDGKGEAIANLYTMPIRTGQEDLYVVSATVDIRSGSKKAALQAIQIGFPRLPDAGSAMHLKVLKAWLTHCNTFHDCYPKTFEFLPTRLLDVSNSESGTIMLMDRIQPFAMVGGYIVLSHCWGSRQEHAQFCTYKSNVAEFRQGINITDLPKTFQDAVRITSGLGRRWLWIDSLCIIQDDQEDWETESKLMEHVFSSAYCTIAASCASGSSDGFLKPIPERLCVAMQGPSADTTYYVCAVVDNFYCHVDQSLLNQRGWVLQERALSRRTIYFTETQSYWECGGGVRCETMTKMKKNYANMRCSRSRKASFLGDAYFPKAAEKYVKGMRIELFQDLYERYSRLALSFPSDRPIAIKGLEARLLDTFNTTGGYGLLDRYLHRCLLWQRSGDTLKRIKPSRGSYLVPSWSWMGYDGPMNYMAISFGQVSWCHKITSPFEKAENRRKSNSHASSTAELEALVWELTSVPGGQIILDEPSRTLRHPVQCIIVGRSKKNPTHADQTHFVLLVHRVADVDEEVYERVGVGTLERRHIAVDGIHRIGRIR